MNSDPPLHYLNIAIRWVWHCRSLWIISHILYASCMLATFFISSLFRTYVLIGLTGISWAITIWVPYTIVSASISHGRQATPHRSDEWETRHSEKQPGIVFGMLNVSIAGPQIVAAVASSVIFWALDRTETGALGDINVWLLRAGALPALVAAFCTISLEGEPL